MKPVPVELRRRILEDCDQGLSERKAAEKWKVGATLFRLPPYSPDWNPIEMSFSKLKSILRKEKIREVGILQEFLRQSPKLFSQIECKNFINHAGYGLHN